MENQPLHFLTFSNLSRFPELLHFITTRQGGVSRGPYASLNLGLHTADDPFAVIRNREILAEALDIDTSAFVWSNQVHEGRVEVMKSGQGFYSLKEAVPDCDSVVTDTRGLCLVVMVADCVPILLYDPVRKVAGVAHAGWRGTVKRVVVNTVERMKSAFGSDPRDILAGIGPSIGPCCYEVGADVEEAISRDFHEPGRYLRKVKGKRFFDLWEANRIQLEESGLMPAHIEKAELCTRCHHDIYYSSRADKGNTGRFVAGIALR